MFIRTLAFVATTLLLTHTLRAAAPATEDAPMANASLDFGNRLMQLHPGDVKNAQNLVFSPTSIYLALSMTAEGARGQTAAQMHKVLGQDASTPEQRRAALLALTGRDDTPKDDDAFQFTLSNAIWVQKSYDLNPAFIDTVTKNYLSQITPLDFAAQTEAARKTINDAIAKQTKDKIKDLLAPGTVTKITRLVLTNAVYLKANWDEPFRKNQTKNGPFHLPDGTTINTIPTMHQTIRRPFFENEQLKVLELPYVGHQLSMLLVLSKNADVSKSMDFESTLKDLPAWNKQAESRLVTIALPKFKFESSMMLSEDLKTLGMADAFSDHADFTGIASHDTPAISEVIHKAFIDVNEEGTEAAAATAVVMRAGAMPRPTKPAEFIADRPFVFAIRHNQTGEILFLGRVTKP